MKIFIFEDEYPIAASLEQHLKSLGYENILTASNLKKAYQIIDQFSPDIAILDIRIPNDNEAGIKVARYLNNKIAIPLIFMTANDDELIIEKALGTKPDGYLSKAFNDRIILYSIERAIENLANRMNAEVEKNDMGSSYIFNTDDYILLRKKRDIFHKVEIQNILYVYSEGGAIKIFTTNGEYSFASTLPVFLSQIEDNSFVKVGRNYIINIRHFDAFLEGNYIQIKDEKLQLSTSEYKRLFNLFEVFRTKTTSK